MEFKAAAIRKSRSPASNHKVFNGIRRRVVKTPSAKTEARRAITIQADRTILGNMTELALATAQLTKL